jgi:WD40 repeat protein
VHLISFKPILSRLPVVWNVIFSDKILTGSFDKTARLWSAETGECYNTLWGHTAEVVTVQFNPHSLLVGTSSMDSTAKLYHIATGKFDMVFPLLHCFSICMWYVSTHHCKSINIPHQLHISILHRCPYLVLPFPLSLACTVLLSSTCYHPEDWSRPRCDAVS